jgi:hypothetical protein
MALACGHRRAALVAHPRYDRDDRATWHAALHVHGGVRAARASTAQKAVIRCVYTDAPSWRGDLTLGDLRHMADACASVFGA